MTTTHTPVRADYVSGYAEGRRAAQAHVSATENPHRPGSPAFGGWNDGYYDEQSARRVAIERHTALIWS